MAQRATIADVAKHAGVSKTTVSMVLRKDAKISESTRQKVMAAAEKLKYVPDPALSRIAAHRWKTKLASSGSTLAYISMAPKNRLPSLRFYGARNMAEELGYRLEFFALDAYPSITALLKIIYNRGIRGVILGRFTVEHRGIIDCSLWSHFSVVACGMGYADPPFHCVIPNFHRSITVSVQKLLERGLRKIGLVVPTYEAHSYKLSLHDGYKYSAFYYETGVSNNGNGMPVFLDEFENAGYFEKFRQWHALSKPEAFIVPVTGRYYDWLRAIGIDCERCAISLSWDEARPEIAGWLLPHDDLGARSVSILHSLMLSNEVGIPSSRSLIMIDMPWRDGRAK